MPPIKALLKVLSLNCDESSRLVSDRFERDLNRYENAALSVHMMTCTGCKRMRKQFTMLHTLNQRAYPRKGGVARLPGDARRRIAKALTK